jgi:hypothetical protein
MERFGWDWLSKIRCCIGKEEDDVLDDGGTGEGMRAGADSCEDGRIVS